MPSAAVVDRLRAGARDRAVSARGIGEGVGVDGEVGRHGDVGGDVGVGARVGRGGVAPVDEVVAGVGYRRHRGAVGAVVDRLRAGARDRAVGARGVGQGVGVDGEAGRHVMLAVTLVSVRGLAVESSLQLTKW